MQRVGRSTGKQLLPGHLAPGLTNIGSNLTRSEKWSPKRSYTISCSGLQHGNAECYGKTKLLNVSDECESWLGPPMGYGAIRYHSATRWSTPSWNRQQQLCSRWVLTNRPEMIAERQWSESQWCCRAVSPQHQREELIAVRRQSEELYYIHRQPNITMANTKTKYSRYTWGDVRDHQQATTAVR